MSLNPGYTVMFITNQHILFHAYNKYEYHSVLHWYDSHSIQLELQIGFAHPLYPMPLLSTQEVELGTIGFPEWVPSGANKELLFLVGEGWHLVLCFGLTIICLFGVWEFTLVEPILSPISMVESWR